MTKFNVKFSDSTYRAVGELARWMDGTMADVIREALSILWWLAKEYRQGNRLLIQRGDQITELLIPSLARLTENAPSTDKVVVPDSIDDEPIEARPGRGRRARAAGED
jgi:hypothetical protein